MPLYLSEIAPAHARGTLNILFQMATTIGIWVAQWINYGTKDMHPHGWRLSVGLAIVPALILFLGSIIIPDTPNSLVYRGKVEQARRTLERVRGTPNVDAEFADIVEAVENGKTANKFAIFQRKYRPVLVSGHQKLCTMSNLLMGSCLSILLDETQTQAALSCSKFACHCHQTVCQQLLTHSSVLLYYRNMTNMTSTLSDCRLGQF